MSKLKKKLQIRLLHIMLIIYSPNSRKLVFIEETDFLPTFEYKLVSRTNCLVIRFKLKSSNINSNFEIKYCNKKN